MSTELSGADKEEIIKGLFNWLLVGYEPHLDETCSHLPPSSNQDFAFLRESIEAQGHDPQDEIEQLRNIEADWLNGSMENHRNRNFRNSK